MYRLLRINNLDNYRDQLAWREVEGNDASRGEDLNISLIFKIRKRNYPNISPLLSPADVNKWKNCRSKVLPAVRIFRGWRASREGEGDRKRLSFARERAAVKSSPVGDEKTNGGGPVRNCVRSATFPSFSRIHDSATLRSLSIRATLQRLHLARTIGIEERERLTGFKCQLRYSEKRSPFFPFFFCVTQ